MNKTNRIGLALSGGQLKATAHIGVIEALEKIGIVPDVVAGTSAGSLVATLYAHGYRTEDFRALLNNFPGMKLLDYGFPLWSSALSWALKQIHINQSSTVPYVPPGILRGQKLIRYVERALANRKSEIPYFIVATDLLSGKPVVFSSEPLHHSDTYVNLTNIPKAVAGSCAIPGIFTPVSMGEHILVDGSIRDYVPVSVLHRAHCDKIIAVNLYRLTTDYRPQTMIDVLARSFDILLRESIDNDVMASPKTYLIEPDFSNIRWKNFSQMKHCYEIGRQTVHNNKSKILDFISDQPSKKAL